MTRTSTTATPVPHPAHRTAPVATTKALPEECDWTEGVWDDASRDSEIFSVSSRACAPVTDGFVVGGSSAAGQLRLYKTVVNDVHVLTYAPHKRTCAAVF